jgi:hypothetical protein
MIFLLTQVINRDQSSPTASKNAAQHNFDMAKIQVPPAFLSSCANATTP